MLDETEATPEPPARPELGATATDASASPPPVSPSAGPPPPWPARIGPYRIEGVLGRGGMGVVYAAVDDKLGRPLALKVIAPAARDHAEARARFWREARALAAVDHPGVVQVHRIDETEDGLLYLAMERVAGASLSDVLSAEARSPDGPAGPGRSAPWPVAAAVALLAQAAAALGAAHRQGITHRDVKPANLLVGPDGLVRVVDFGLARRTDGDDRITETGAVLGTPAYMAPEQVEGRGVSPATDVFALGVVGYRLLTGAHPFARESREATALALAAGRFAPVLALAPSVPPAVAAAVEACLLASPLARPADGEALAGWLLEALPAAAPEDLAAQVAGALGGGRPSGAAAAPGLRGLGGARTPAVVGVPRPPQDGARDASAGPVRTEGALESDGPVRAAGAPASGPMSGPSLPAHLRPSRWPWALGAVAAATAAAAALWMGAKPAPPPRATGQTPASAAPNQAASNLPARPVVAVLDFTGAGLAPDDRRPAVLSERLRRQLDVAPDRLQSLCRETVAAMVGPEGPLRAPVAELPARVDVVVEGSLAPSQAETPGGLTATLTATRRRDGQVLAHLVFEVTEDPEEIAAALGGALVEALGLPPLPEATPWRASVEAVATWLDSERALEQGDHDRARTALARALRLAPDFVPARLSELSQLRLERRQAEMTGRIEALATLGHLSARDRARVEVWRALVAERGGEAMALLRGMAERWPYDVQAARLEMALRFFDPAVRDLAEAEGVARRILEVAPREEDAASRLVRVLAFRARGHEIEPTLRALGVPMETDAFTEVRGDVALMVGDFPAAIAAYDAAVGLAGEDVYSLNMGIAARVLDGQCEAAAAAALARVDRVEAEGRDGNLDWTYSLGTQALLCAGRDAALETLLDRWSKHSASGAGQSLALRPRMRIAQGEDPAEIAAWILGMIDAPQTLPESRPALARTLARVVLDRAGLERVLARAEDAVMDPALDVTQRRGWEQARVALGLRARLLDLLAGAAEGDGGMPGAGADADLGADAEARARLVADSWAAVPVEARMRHEGDLVTRIEELGRHAELLEALGSPDEARSVWRLVADAGYGRLWSTDLWLRARARLAPP